MDNDITRADALQLMQEWTESESLRKHMLSVEAAVVAYARKFGADEEEWAMAGLLHDLDYERYPNPLLDRKSTRLNSSHVRISYAVFCLKKKKKQSQPHTQTRE